MITAAFKSICYQTKDIITILESNGISINSLLVDGGMTANESFLQILADSLQKEVAKPSNTESTALGACIVCQIADGVAMEEIKTLIESKYRSNSKLNNFYKKDYEDWKMFIDSSLK
jgi:glycerol kinase